MSARPGEGTDSIAWHSQIAEHFDNRYRSGRMFRERLELWSGVLGECIGRGSKVADLGCGPGLLAAVAATRAQSVIAVDASPEMVRLARKNIAELRLSNVEIVEARLESLRSIVRSGVDVLICSSVFEYLGDGDAFLRDCYSALEPGGTLLISVPNASSFYRRAERLVFQAVGRPTYLRFVTYDTSCDSIADRLRAAGFELRRVEHFGMIPVLSTVFGWFKMRHHMETMTLIRASRP